MIAQNTPSVETSGIILACAVIVSKSVWEMIYKNGKKENGCGITPKDNLLILQTHTLAEENNKILVRHFDEVSNLSGSIKDLVQSISDSRAEDSRTQQRQTQILERLTDIFSQTKV